jgi:hypothetical protein
MLKLTTIPTRNPDVLGRMVDDEAVLVMPQKGKVKVINQVGAAIWESIDDKRNIQQIVEEICAQFDVEQATAESDTLKFIAELADREIVFLKTT